MQAFLVNKLPELQALFRQYPIDYVYAFGSVCTDQFHENSDIDLIISLSDKLDPLEYGDIYWELDEVLPKIIGKKVDLLTEKMLKNPYFIKVVNQTKTLIYERSGQEIFA